jgi:hypothetical protein
MWSPLLSTPKTNTTMILQSNLSMWSPLLNCYVCFRST